MNFLLWPFRIVWVLISFIFGLTGRFIAVILGLVLMIVGLVLTITFIGAIIGIPLIVLGVLLAIKAFF